MYTTAICIFFIFIAPLPLSFILTYLTFIFLYVFLYVFNYRTKIEQIVFPYITLFIKSFARSTNINIFSVNVMIL